MPVDAAITAAAGTPATKNAGSPVRAEATLIAAMVQPAQRAPRHAKGMSARVAAPRTMIATATAHRKEGVAAELRDTACDVDRAEEAGKDETGAQHTRAGAPNRDWVGWT